MLFVMFLSYFICDIVMLCDSDSDIVTLWAARHVDLRPQQLRGGSNDPAGSNSIDIQLVTLVAR